MWRDAANMFHACLLRGSIAVAPLDDLKFTSSRNTQTLDQQNRQSPIVSVQGPRTTLASQFAVPHGTHTHTLLPYLLSRNFCDFFFEVAWGFGIYRWWGVWWIFCSLRFPRSKQSTRNPRKKIGQTSEQKSGQTSGRSFYIFFSDQKIYTNEHESRDSKSQCNKCRICEDQILFLGQDMTANAR